MDIIKVNDCVKVDGRLRGRVSSIVKPIGTYHMFNVKLENGSTMQVARYRLQRMPETVSTTSTMNVSDNDMFDAYLSGVDFDEILNEDVCIQIPTQAELEDLFNDSRNEIEDKNGQKQAPTYCTDEDITQYIQTNQNVNTARKTNYDVRILTKFMALENDKREIPSIPAEELCKILCKFIINAKKVDGSEYEPSTVRGIISSVDRLLKQRGYGKSIMMDVEFTSVREVLKTKQKILKQSGKGNLPQRAESLSEDDINTLWQSGELGLHNPESLINTLWWHNTIHFGLRTVTPHKQMKWGDVTLHTDTNGVEYLAYNERQTKTRTGVNTRDVRTVVPKAWSTSTDRCPVSAYKRYAELRPSEYSAADCPFYLATNSKTAPAIPHPWYKRQPLGINKIGALMRRMAQNCKLDCKRLTNHSARKYLVQTLSESNIPPNQIMQISGHKNMQSINNYSQLSEKQHRDISTIINQRPSSSNVNMTSESGSSGLSSVARARSSLPMSVDSRNVTVSASEFRSINSIFGGSVSNCVINVNFIGNNKDSVPPADTNSN